MKYQSSFTGEQVDLLLSEVEKLANLIYEDDTGDLVIADGEGNILIHADDTGLETTHLSTGSLTVNGVTVQEMIKAYVDEAILGGEW